MPQIPVRNWQRPRHSRSYMFIAVAWHRKAAVLKKGRKELVSWKTERRIRKDGREKLQIDCLTPQAIRGVVRRRRQCKYSYLFALNDHGLTTYKCSSSVQIENGGRLGLDVSAAAPWQPSISRDCWHSTATNGTLTSRPLMHSASLPHIRRVSQLK